MHRTDDPPCRMRIGFYLPGVSKFPSGSWTRLRDLSWGLSNRPDVDLFVATDDIEDATDLQIPSERTLVLPPATALRRAHFTSRRVLHFVQTFRLDLVHFETIPI